jgi:hypothetical protein
MHLSLEGWKHEKLADSQPAAVGPGEEAIHGTEANLQPDLLSLVHVVYSAASSGIKLQGFGFFFLFKRANLCLSELHFNPSL